MPFFILKKRKSFSWTQSTSSVRVKVEMKLWPIAWSWKNAIAWLKHENNHRIPKCDRPNRSEGVENERESKREREWKSFSAQWNERSRKTNTEQKYVNKKTRRKSTQTRNMAQKDASEKTRCKTVRQHNATQFTDAAQITNEPDWVAIHNKSIQGERDHRTFSWAQLRIEWRAVLRNQESLRAADVFRWAALHNFEWGDDIIVLTVVAFVQVM